MQREEKKPTLPLAFIGSSQEGIRIAAAVKAELSDQVSAVIWSQGVFGLGMTAIEALERTVQECEFAVLVATPADILDSRGSRMTSARGNILFQAGLFMGRLGRERTFLICPQDSDLRFPSDLAGLTVAEYSSKPAESNGGLRGSLRPACDQIKEALGRFSKPPHEHKARTRRRNTLGVALSRGPQDEMRIVNLSMTGAFLETGGAIPVGRSIDLELRLDSGSVVTLRAEVVRVQTPDWRRIGGVGVAFRSISAETELALKAFVEPGSNAA